MIDRAYWAGYTAWHARHERGLPWWSRARLDALQDRRVREIVAFAHATVPHYRDVMDARGLGPSDVATAADLARLPLVDGRALAARPDRFVSSACGSRDTLELTTTGTSGDFKRIRHDTRAIFAALAAGGRMRAVAASVMAATGRKPVRVAQLVIAPPAGTNAVIRDFHALHLPRWLTRRHAQTFLSPDRPFAELVAAINALAPDMILSFGRFAGYLYRRALESGVAIHAPRVLRYGGDAMPAADRHLIEERLGVPVLSSYQSCEFPGIAFQCERREGFHVSTDQVVLRVVDDQGRDVPPGTPGEAVVSNLVNRATVLLNYRLGDRVTMATGRCACGRTLPLISALDGRIEDLLVRADGERVHESIVLPRVYAVPGLANVAIVQRARAHVEAALVVSPGADVASVVDGLRRAISGLVGEPPGLEIAIGVVDRIPGGPGGKFRAVTCEIAT